MSDTVLGWLCGGWTFGSWGKSGRGRLHAQQSHRDVHDEIPAHREERQHRQHEIQGVPVAELVSRVRNGDAAAFSVLYTEFYEPLTRLALLIVRAPDIAEELVQDIFLELWTRDTPLDIHADLRVYLYVAVRNRAQSVLRHRRTTGAFEAAVEANALDIPAIGQRPPRPDELVTAREIDSAYQRALATLQDRDRVALLLRWEQQMTYEELGRVFGLSVVGVRKLVLRAAHKVQILLEPYRG